MNKLDVRPFFDKETKSLTYVVTDRASKQVAIIDSVLDFDPNTRQLSSGNADKIIKFIDDNNLHLEWILETHAHSDHISAARYLKEKRGGQIGIGEHIDKVQRDYKRAFNLNMDMRCDGSEFDYLFQDGEIIYLGHIEMEVINTPGHSPAGVSYKIEDALFVGNALLMPDFGTDRTDLPSGSAKCLYQSIQRILSLPDTTRIFIGHDNNHLCRDERFWETSVFQEKRDNIHLKNETKEEEFIRNRFLCDLRSPPLRLLFPSVQMNLRAGRLPDKECNGSSYLIMPLMLGSVK